MPNNPVYTDDEWGLLVGLPQSVVVAASAAEQDGTLRTHAESEAGFDAIAAGRDCGSPLVEAVAQEVIYTIGLPEASAPVIEPDDPPTVIAAVLTLAEQSIALIKSKATEAEASAYGHWLVNIAEEVAGAARSGGVLGIGGEMVSEAERRFIDQLIHVVQD